MKKYLILLLAVFAMSCHTNRDKQERNAKVSENIIINEAFLNDSTVLIDKDAYVRANAECEKLRASARKNPSIEAENEIYHLAGIATEMKTLSSIKNHISNYLNDECIWEYDFILTYRFLNKFSLDFSIDSTRDKAFNMFYLSIPYLTYVLESELCPTPLKEQIRLLLLPINNYYSEQVELDIDLQRKFYKERLYSKDFKNQYKRIIRIGRARR